MQMMSCFPPAMCRLIPALRQHLPPYLQPLLIYPVPRPGDYTVVNHRVAEAGLGLWTWSNAPAQTGPPAVGCPGPCPDGFGYLLGRRPQNLPVQPVPVLSHHE